MHFANANKKGEDKSVNSHCLISAFAASVVTIIMRNPKTKISDLFFLPGLKP